MSKRGIINELRVKGRIKKSRAPMREYNVRGLFGRIRKIPNRNPKELRRTNISSEQFMEVNGVTRRVKFELTSEEHRDLFLQDWIPERVFWVFDKLFDECKELIQLINQQSEIHVWTSSLVTPVFGRRIAIWRCDS